MSFAKGKYAFGFCDKTGFRYPLHELKEEYNNGAPTGFLVGPDVWDGDQPQNFLGRLKIFDPQSLRNPRPDRFEDSRGIFGFNPVGGNIEITGFVGTVTLDIPVPESDTVTGVSGSASVGSVSVLAGNAPRFDSTSITLDSTTDTFDEG